MARARYVILNEAGYALFTAFGASPVQLGGYYALPETTFWSYYNSIQTTLEGNYEDSRWDYWDSLSYTPRVWSTEGYFWY